MESTEIFPKFLRILKSLKNVWADEGDADLQQRVGLGTAAAKKGSNKLCGVQI